jgi:glycosyltransferase involved in cell wall biosynthesis
MNIAIFTSTYLPEIGGIQFELYWLLKAIDKIFKSKGIDRFVFILPHYKNQRYLSFDNIEVVEMDKQLSKKNIVSGTYQLAKIVRKYDIDLINCFAVIPDGFFCACLNIILKTPFIVTSQGEDLAVDKRFNYGGRLIKEVSIATKFTLKRAKSLITISRDMIKFAIDSGADKNRIAIIPNGIEMNQDVSSKINEVEKEIKKKYAISESHIIFITLSGMRKIKGHVNMVKAFALAVKSNPNVRLFIGAHGAETENIKSLVKELNIDNYVKFIGFISDDQKDAWFNIAHVYCNTAYFEPFGIVYIEAIKSQIAVLGSIKGGGRDIFKHKQSAHLVDPESIEQIYQGIVALTKENYRRRLTLNAKQLLPLYDINRIAHMYLDTYLEGIK